MTVKPHHEVNQSSVTLWINPTLSEARINTKNSKPNKCRIIQICSDSVIPTLKSIFESRIKEGHFPNSCSQEAVLVRPVISNNGTITENVSAFLDFHLKTIVPTIPHILEDTRDFLSRLKVPENAILVSFDARVCIRTFLTNKVSKFGNNIWMNETRKRFLQRDYASLPN